MRRLAVLLLAAPVLAALIVGARPSPPAGGGATPAWLAGATPGHWIRIGSAVMTSSPVMADVGKQGTSTWNPGLKGIDGFNWTSGDVDVRNSRLYLFAPGGHGYNDPSGNESWNGTAVLDLEADAPQWALAAPSTPMRLRTFGSTGYYADGRPAATHNYNYIHYITSRNRVFRMGSDSVWSNPTRGGSKLASLNTVTGVYDPDGYSPDWLFNPGHDSLAVKLLNEDILIASNGYERMVWHAATNTFDRIKDGSMRSGYVTGVLDTRRNRVFSPVQPDPGAGGVPGPFMTDGMTFAQTRFPLTFPGSSATETSPPWYGSSGLGMAFYQHPTDPSQDYFLLASAGQLRDSGQTWKVDAMTGAVSDLGAVNGTGTPIAYINSCYGRFRWVPRLGGVVYAAGPGSDGVWFLPLGPAQAVNASRPVLAQ